MTMIPNSNSIKQYVGRLRPGPDGANITGTN